MMKSACVHCISAAISGHPGSKNLTASSIHKSVNRTFFCAKREYYLSIKDAFITHKENGMSNNKETIRLSLSISPELNERLEQLASSGHTTKTEILRKAIALYDVAAEAKTEKKKLGILDQNKQLLAEIVGI